MVKLKLGNDEADLVVLALKYLVAALASISADGTPTPFAEWGKTKFEELLAEITAQMEDPHGD